MTTPERPEQRAQTDEPDLAAEPAQVPPPPAQSLMDRLSQLEPEDDDDLFDDDDYDVDEDDDPDEAAPEPMTPDDDSAFAVAAPAVAPADQVEEHPTIALAPDRQETAVLPAALPAPEPDAEPAEPAAEPVGGAAAEADEATGERRRARRRRRVSVPVLALLLMTALMAAATTYLWLEVRERDRTEDARRAGLDASRDAARLLFSYDYRTLDKDFSTGRALTTGAFRSQYDKTTTKVVADVAKQYKAVVKANVVSAGVVRASPSTVVTVVYVNQVTTSTRVTGEKVDLSRVRMTLERSGDRWLVTAVNAL